LTVRTIHLDHGTPVLAFALEERFHINIIKEALDRLALPPGPWLNRFKAMCYGDVDPQTTVEIPTRLGSGASVSMSLGELSRTIARISRGQRLVYIADAAGTPENIARMIALADGADHLFVEAAFSHDHREIARQKQHLTARQAGELARACRVKQYSLFHYSPRYSDCPDLLEAEAEEAFSR
jgi:ribonuclease Z